MEDGKRYENMAWRLWSRETFCCQPLHRPAPAWSFERQLPAPADMPELSSSVASDDSNVDDASAPRPEFRRHDSANSQARGRHLTPIGLEKVVNSIQEKRFLEPLSPLPPQLAPPVAAQPMPTHAAPCYVSPPTTARRVPASSTSTVATSHARGSDAMSPATGSEASTSTDISRHSVVRGFEPGHVSTSVRSSTNLAPTPILKSSLSFVSKPIPSKADGAKKRAPMFTLGGSSDEDATSSFGSYSLQKRSSLTETLRKAAPAMRKTTSFKNEVSTRTYTEMTSESEGAIESDSDDDDVNESAIDDDDDDSDAEWEDDEGNEESRPASPKESSIFQRQDSRANLTSHRSLLTSALHQGDRAQALQLAASRSTPAIRRSRTTTPNGPSTGNSPQEEGLMMRQQPSKGTPIIMTTSNVHPPAMSPRTARRNMLQHELSSSLRSNLLWERQQKNVTNNAFVKRGQSAISLPALRRAATTTDLPLRSATTQTKHDDAKVNSSYTNEYFSGDLSEYHTRGVSLAKCDLPFHKLTCLQW
jgi:hypothetical protein